MIAFILDIGNTERLTGGFKDLKTGKVLPIKIESVGNIDWGCDRIVYYTENDSTNRPCKVKRLDLNTGEETCLFVDDDPTHYLDIGITKDKKYIVINSNTKEDSEVWVTERSSNLENPLPKKIVSRVKDV